MKYYPINEAEAAKAREMWSFYEYKEGSETASYKSRVDACYELVEELPEELKAKGEAIADSYARRLAEWKNKQFRIEMMCPSVMICGAGNFPVAKKAKQNAAQDRHYMELNKIEALPDKIRNLARGSNFIKSSDSDALDKLKLKLETLEKKQAEMKAANAYYRKNKTLKGFSSFSETKAAELDETVKESIYDVPFPPYTLTNNNAKINNVKSRISELERVKTEASADYETELFTVKENTDLMRLQIFFDEKPDADTRAILKSNGFKWAPSQNAWQRQLTDNAKRALKKILEEIK